MAKGVLEVAHIFGLVNQERGAKKQGKEAKTWCIGKRGWGLPLKTEAGGQAREAHWSKEEIQAF